MALVSREGEHVARINVKGFTPHAQHYLSRLADEVLARPWHVGDARDPSTRGDFHPVDQHPRDWLELLHDAVP